MPVNKLFIWVHNKGVTKDCSNNYHVIPQVRMGTVGGDDMEGEERG